MTDDLAARLGIAVPDYWAYEPPSITRRMASMLAELEAAGLADEIAHLGPGYPSPAVSYPEEDDAHFAAWLKWRSGNPLKPMPIARILSDLRAYGPTQGPPDFRRNFAQVYGSDFGGVMDPASLIPTIGATGGIDLVASAVDKYGEPVAVITDSPTYAGITARLADSPNSKIYSVEMDDEGPIPEMFAEAIDQARKDGRFVGFYYTIPDGHNPGGMSFSQARRDVIYRICREKDILLVEDAPYTYISFESEASRPKPFFATDPDGRVIHLFTASKIWEPGMRVAYAHVPAQLLTEDKRNLSFRDILLSLASKKILFHNPTALAFFDSLLHRQNDDGSFELSTLWDRARRKVDVYGENRAILLDGLAHYLGEHRDQVTWTVPGAGFFVVVRFAGAPFKTDLNFVGELLRQDRVTAIPMDDFFPADAKERDPGIADRSLRLAFSFTRSAEPEKRRAEIQTAVERFGNAIVRRLGRGGPRPAPLSPDSRPAGNSMDSIGAGVRSAGSNGSLSSGSTSQVATQPAVSNPDASSALDSSQNAAQPTFRIVGTETADSELNPQVDGSLFQIVGASQTEEEEHRTLAKQTQNETPPNRSPAMPLFGIHSSPIARPSPVLFFAKI